MIEVQANNSKDVHVKLIEGELSDIIRETASILFSLTYSIAKGTGISQEDIITDVISFIDHINLNCVEEGK